MKNYKEMARDLLARRDAYKQQQKRKKRRRERVVLCAASIALLLLGGFGIWRSGIGKQDVDYVPIAEVEIQEKMDRSQMQMENSQTEENNSAIDETDSLEEKDNKDSTTKNQADKESQDLQEGNKRVEFTIHNKNSHAIMGVTLPKGWNYSFVGSTHEELWKDNQCCCSDPTEDVRTACTCGAERDKESALICQNAFKGKGVQSESKDLEEYGISFWKEENPKMKIQYLYHKDRLFFCATGVTIGKETLDNGGTSLKAESFMEEIDKGIWYTLILDRTNLITGEKGDYAIHCEVEKKLWNQYQKEIKDILEGITLHKCR